MTNEPYMHWHMNYIINSDIGNDSNYFNNSDIGSDTQTISLTGGISKEMWTLAAGFRWLVVIDSSIFSPASSIALC